MRRLQQTRQALGSTVQITLVGEVAKSQEVVWFTDLWAIIDAFEARFSRFLKTSELTHVNRQAGTKIGISEEFYDLLATAQELAVQTQGLFNPFVLPDLQRAGYLSSWTEPQREAISYEERRLAPINNLQFGPDWAKLPPNSALDFGGIGKGYLLDRLRERLGGLSLRGYWISLGGDIICQGYDLEGPWRIGIQHATDVDGSAGVYENTTGEPMAVATSGVTKRRGVKNGQPWHHLIDPRTGQPSKTDVLTATVVSRSATQADVVAKCLVLLGSRESGAFMKRQPDIVGSLIQSTDHKQEPAAYTTGVLKEIKS